MMLCDAWAQHISYAAAHPNATSSGHDVCVEEVHCALLPLVHSGDGQSYAHTMHAASDTVSRMTAHALHDVASIAATSIMGYQRVAAVQHTLSDCRRVT